MQTAPAQLAKITYDETNDVMALMLFSHRGNRLVVDSIETVPSRREAWKLIRTAGATYSEAA